MPSFQICNMRFYGHQKFLLCQIAGPSVGSRLLPAEPSTRAFCHDGLQSRMCLATGKRQDVNLPEMLRTEHSSACYFDQDRHSPGAEGITADTKFLHAPQKRKATATRGHDLYEVLTVPESFGSIFLP
jgi:hypothetical protein